ncbi:hypothetical protein [Rhodococcus sp. BS-15]|nr:hypothetical protein [Rhodococcus sp. BS-15]
MKLQPRLLADLARLTTALDSSTVDLADWWTDCPRISTRPYRPWSR